MAARPPSTNDTVDGGAGTNRLSLQADTRSAPGGWRRCKDPRKHRDDPARLGRHYERHHHCGHGPIGIGDRARPSTQQYGGNDVTVTNLVTAKSVLFTGDNIDDLTLDATSLARPSQLDDGADRRGRHAEHQRLARHRREPVEPDVCGQCCDQSDHRRERRERQRFDHWSPPAELRLYDCGQLRTTSLAVSSTLRRKAPPAHWPTNRTGSGQSDAGPWDRQRSR